MEILNQFLREKNATANFTITFNGKKFPPTECLIKFLFIQFGVKSLRGYIFMPDYIATSDLKSKIVFTNKKDKQLKITLFSGKDQDIKTWYQFATNSNLTLNSFLDIMYGSNLAYEQNFGSEQHGYILKVTPDYVFTLTDSDECIVNYQISSKTNVVLTNLNEEPRVGLYDDDGPSKPTYVTIPDLEGIFRWTLLLKCCVATILKKEEEQFNSLELTDASEATSSSSFQFSLKKDEEVDEMNDLGPSLLNEPELNERRKDSIHENKSKPPKLEGYNGPSQIHMTTKSSSKSTKEWQSTNRRLSVDANTLSKYNQKVKKQMEQLRVKKDNYRKTINIPEAVPEPEIEPPVIFNGSRISAQDQSYTIVEKEKQPKMSGAALLEIIEPRIQNPMFNFNRYSENYSRFDFQMPLVEFVPEEKYRDSFKSLFLRSIGMQVRQAADPSKPQQPSQKDPKLAFLLLSSMVSNGFRGTSLAEFFKVQKQSSAMYDILAILRKYKKGIFEFMLSIPESEITSIYAPWSLIRNDRQFIEGINEKYIKGQTDTSESLAGDFVGPLIKFEPTFPMPDSVPFQFAFRPFDFIQKFLYDVLYIQRISTVNPQTFIVQLSKMLYSLFSHYLVFEINESGDELYSKDPGFIYNPITVSGIMSSSVSIASFIREVLSKVPALKKPIPPWSHLTFQQEFSQSWIAFWAASFHESKLAENFVKFFQHPELLRKFYYPCSAMRNIKYIQNIAEMLNLISHIDITKDFEISSAALSTPITPLANLQTGGSDNKILKNIAGLIGLH